MKKKDKSMGDFGFFEGLFVILIGSLILGGFMACIAGTYIGGCVIASIIIAIFFIITGEWLIGLFVIAFYVITLIQSMNKIGVSSLKKTEYKTHHNVTGQKHDSGNQRIIGIVLLISIVVIAITFSIILFINNSLLVE